MLPKLKRFCDENLGPEARQVQSPLVEDFFDVSKPLRGGSSLCPRAVRQGPYIALYRATLRSSQNTALDEVSQGPYAKQVMDLVIKYSSEDTPVPLFFLARPQRFARKFQEDFVAYVSSIRKGVVLNKAQAFLRRSVIQELPPQQIELFFFSTLFLSLDRANVLFHMINCVAMLYNKGLTVS